MNKTKKLEFKTGRLPLNFIALGYMLSAVGIWRLVLADWMGLLYLAISVVLICFRSGIILDTDNRMLKMYKGILFFRMGKWEDISQLINIQVIKTRETQVMNVLSISRKETYDTFKLCLNMPDKRIALMSGREDDILRKAKEVASFLHTPLNDIVYE